MTKEQQLANQKKEKKGVKARKDAQTDEAALRVEIEAAQVAEFDAAVALQENELALTKVRLIARLQQSLDDLRLTTAKMLSAAEADTEALTAGVTDLCTALADENIIDVTPATLIKQRRPMSEIGAAITQLGGTIASRLRDNEAVARRAEREMAVMEEALRKTKEHLCAAESILAAKHVPSTTEYLNAAELFRQQGAAFEARMAAMEAERRNAFQTVIRDAAEPKYHLYGGLTSDGRKLTPLSAHPAEDIMQRYLTQTQRALVAQSDLLMDVQSQIAALTEAHVARCGDALRRGRTNLTDDVRALLAAEGTTKEDLLCILDYLSFEPHVSESISALVRLRDAAEGATDAVLSRAPHDLLTAAAHAAATPTAMAVLPPRVEKMAFARSTFVDAADRVRPGFGGAQPQRLQAK
jgi:hypothetical protein